MLGKFGKFILSADRFLDDSRKYLNVALLVGLVLFIGSQNPRIGDTSFRAICLEIGMVLILLLGLFVSKLTKRPFKIIVLFWFYIFGLAFEILTETHWDYRYVAFLIREDISLTFPLAWTGLCLIATSLSEFFYKAIQKTTVVNIRNNLLYRLDILVWIITGSILETMFHRFGMIHEYLKEYPLGLSPLGPPWWVLIGYGFLGFILSMLVRNLEYDAVSYEIKR